MMKKEKEERQRRNINWGVFFLCLLAVFVVALIGSLFTSGNADTEWYKSIKPSIAPPGFVIGLVWNVLFFLIAVSLYLSWRRSRNRKMLAVFFGLNFILNMLWSFLFFQLRSPSAGFICIIFLMISIIQLITYTWKIDKRAGLLLVPYLLWVGFASVLNYLAAF